MDLRAVSAAVPSFDAVPDPAGADRRPPPAPAGHDAVGARADPSVREISSRRAPDPSSLVGLAACVEDARAAALAGGDGPPDPEVFATLRSRLADACAKLPPEYRRAVGEPLIACLDRLGPRGFARLLAQDPAREGGAGLLLDVAQAVLQRGEGYRAQATAAFQEVVSDLYAGFLSAEDRSGVKPPDHGVLPPLVRWGSADAGPYTWPATDTAAVGAQAAVVSLPDANARGGLLAWAALAHETAGHDVLSADDGLRDELAADVREALLAGRMSPAVADYWASRIDETASDVMGVLNMGPAAAVGLVGYFRGLNGAWGGTASLRNVGPADDPHPADIARAYLAAETVRLLPFRGASAWADRLVAEADRDLGQVRLGGVAVSAAAVKASAAAVARAIVQTRLRALDGHALGEVQTWSDRDEAIVADLRGALRDGGAAPGRYDAGAYAAHAVAAGVYEAAAGADPAPVMDRMIGILAEMHARGDAAAPAVAAAAPRTRAVAARVA